MTPQVRQGLIFAACGVVAVVLGWQIADGKVFSFDLAGLVAAGALVLAVGAILVRVFRLPADVTLLGAVLFGYIVGNRGFAQLMVTSSLPLLPAEAALLVAGGWWIVASAFERRLPWDGDRLNRLVLLWLVAGTVRLFFDVRGHGFLAIRDFAMVYYAVFFFIVQRMARRDAARRYLAGCLVAGSMLVPLGVELTGLFPQFFFVTLTFQGAPLIYYKGDLAFTFVAVGSFLCFFAARGRHRAWAWPLAAALFLFVGSGDNRASLFGAVVVMAVLLAAGRWQYPVIQSVAAAAALAVLVVASVAFQNEAAHRRLSSIGDRVASVVDFEGLRHYGSSEDAIKADNNRFRWVWWRDVVLDTWNTNPAFGQGFGADLAKTFVQEYSPDLDEEFATRSPHNIFLSVFGRMGLAGLAVWLTLCGVLVAEAWRTFRAGDQPMATGLWCAVGVILASASFGVVLEGPMGAVPFWSALGLAHAMTLDGRRAAEKKLVAKPNPMVLQEVSGATEV